jgi:hypothetical protein
MSASAVCAKADRRAKNAIIVKVCKFENEGEKKSCGEMCNNLPTKTSQRTGSKHSRWLKAEVSAVQIFS